VQLLIDLLNSDENFRVCQFHARKQKYVKSFRATGCVLDCNRTSINTYWIRNSWPNFMVYWKCLQELARLSQQMCVLRSTRKENRPHYGPYKNSGLKLCDAYREAFLNFVNWYLQRYTLEKETPHPLCLAFMRCFTSVCTRPLGITCTACIKSHVIHGVPWEDANVRVWSVTSATRNIVPIYFIKP
jgi:hypothetical protein